MWKILKSVILIVILVILFLVIDQKTKKDKVQPTNTNIPTSTSTTTTDIPAVTVIADKLEIPWDIAFLPGGDMMISERVGKLSLLKKDGTISVIHNERIEHKGEGGLLGIVLHPNFLTNHYIYLYASAPATNGNTENRIERYVLDGQVLKEKKTIISGIPGAIYHDGGRMEFGPDGFLYVTTGDATTPEIAKNKASLGGKILRLKDDGSLVESNPFDTRVYSYGHRNPQGLAWDAAGQLWSTEHGRSGITSGLDEINLIKAGGNYGWPDSEGDKVVAGTIAPVLHSTSAVTWAPASLAYSKERNSLFFGGLFGQSLYEAVLDGDKVKELKVHFNKEFGRIRTVRIAPDGMLYLTTSNRDGRGSPKEGDDKILKVNPEKLQRD